MVHGLQLCRVLQRLSECGAAQLSVNTKSSIRLITLHHSQIFPHDSDMARKWVGDRNEGSQRKDCGESIQMRVSRQSNKNRRTKWIHMNSCHGNNKIFMRRWTFVARHCCDRWEHWFYEGWVIGQKGCERLWSISREGTVGHLSTLTVAAGWCRTLTPPRHVLARMLMGCQQAQYD